MKVKARINRAEKDHESDMWIVGLEIETDDLDWVREHLGDTIEIQT